ncbi:transcription factor TFIIIC subunit tfc4 [Quaeritorhiza haematococci]|nr:transcription factor TFIIIC subunit tfc4 [Quaeritorhiza haematococci]
MDPQNNSSTNNQQQQQYYAFQHPPASSAPPAVVPLSTAPVSQAGASHHQDVMVSVSYLQLQQAAAAAAAAAAAHAHTHTASQYHPSQYHPVPISMPPPSSSSSSSVPSSLASPVVGVSTQSAVGSAPPANLLDLFQDQEQQQLVTKMSNMLSSSAASAAAAAAAAVAASANSGNFPQTIQTQASSAQSLLTTASGVSAPPPQQQQQQALPSAPILTPSITESDMMPPTPPSFAIPMQHQDPSFQSQSHHLSAAAAAAAAAAQQQQQQQQRSAYPPQPHLPPQAPQPYPSHPSATSVAVPQSANPYPPNPMAPAFPADQPRGVSDVDGFFEEAMPEDYAVPNQQQFYGEGEDDEDEFDDQQQDDADDSEDIPVNIGQYMNDANVDVGTGTQYSQVLFEEDQDAIREIEEEMGIEGFTMGGRTKRKKTRRRKKKTTILTKELSEMVGEANIAYSHGQYQESLRILHEVIRAAPNAHEAWVTLGTIYEELGNTTKAMGAYLMAAHLIAKDADLWKRLGQMSMKLGHTDQAIYCLSKAIVADPTDVDALWDRSYLFYEEKRYQRAIDGYLAILKYVPHNIYVIKELCKIYVELGETAKAIALFEGAMEADKTMPLTDVPEDQDGDVFDEDEEDDRLVAAAAAKKAGIPPPSAAPGPSAASSSDEEVIGELTMGTQVPASTSFKFRMGYEELNMLAELYIEVGDYDKAAMAIKEGVWRLRGGSLDHQPFVLDNADADADAEFSDEERDGEFKVPLELRVKLGICRLWMDQGDLAKMHFRPLFAASVEQYAELFFDVAEAYIGRRMFTNALAVLEYLITFEKTDNPTTWGKMAYCHQQLGNLETAAELYSSVLEVVPDDFDIKLTLAEVYEELGEEEKALELVHEVDEASKIREKGKSSAGGSSASASAGASATGDGTDGASSSVPAIISSRSSKSSAEDRAIAAAAEAARERENKANFVKMGLLFPSIADRIALTKVFTGNQQRRKSHREAVDEAMHRLNPEMEENDQYYLPPPKMSEMPASHQGLTFDEWYEVFIKYAAALTIDSREEEAHEALKAAFDANVFYHNEQRKVALRLHMLAAAIYAKNYARVAEVCRWFLIYKPFANDMFRLYNACLAGGSEAVSAYASSATQKYFVRQIRAMDRSSGVTSKGLGASLTGGGSSGSGTASKRASTIRQSPLLLTLYGHILLCARSFTQAIAYYIRAYHISPEDPLINMSLGIAYLHRGMQRKSENRHMHIMQGFTFMFRYYELRGQNQEACYNVARAFHQIGLTHLAIPYYERVLAWGRQRPPNPEDDEDREPMSENPSRSPTPPPLPLEESMDLRREAAYNLAMIYVGNGSPGLAQQLLRTHCTI